MEEEDQRSPDAAANEQEVKDQTPDGPIKFLGTNCYMGLAPSTTKEGDIIARFWACNAALVMRRDRSGYRLRGRAHVADSGREGREYNYALSYMDS
jgi:hypothetical protein